MLGFHPIQALVPAGARSSSLKSRGTLAAGGQCAQSAILPADFMGTSGSAPLPPSGLTPSKTTSTSSSTSVGAIAAVALLVGLAFWFLKGR